jgi:ribosomal subunit interface protein
MQIPAKISFHNIDSSMALKDRINEKIAKLEQRVKNLMGIHVIVEAAHHHQTKGRLYSVRIDATMPGGELVVSHHPGRNPRKHDKVFAAMNAGFAALERQLQRFKEIGRRQDVKLHKENWQEGVVSNLVKKDGFGFLATILGDEIYFHKNAVDNNRFNDLDIGTKVRFVLSATGGREGPQVSILRL